jgi:TctA family transporter
MELFTDLGLGFATALSPFNLMYCFIGVLLGTAVGVLPGLGRSPPSPCCCRSLSACRRSPP